ncbi:cytochrome c [Methylobacillus flagellatus]|uniref:cytochrome c n=1 Tax=Methylobacillus flagellatus TaxID=405 RepID=UPI0010F4FE73|nr:cytochrome c [Methylobacillus flagellatus]
MRRIALLLISTLCASLAQATPLFSAGDPVIGKAMVEKQCISCHADRFGGDGSGIYTREHRLVKTSAGLLTQVRNCNTNLGLKWFDDEELHVTRYLNDHYYKFQK